MEGDVEQACQILLGQNCWVLSKNLLSTFLFIVQSKIPLLEMVNIG